MSMRKTLPPSFSLRQGRRKRRRGVGLSELVETWNARKCPLPEVSNFCCHPGRDWGTSHRSDPKSDRFTIKIQGGRRHTNRRVRDPPALSNLNHPPAWYISSSPSDHASATGDTPMFSGGGQPHFGRPNAVRRTSALSKQPPRKPFLRNRGTCGCSRLP